MIPDSNTSNIRFYKAKGCTHCDETGYQGRSGIYELLQVTPRIQDAIKARVDSNTVRQVAYEEGMKSMFDDGLAKVITGEIDLAELLHATYD